MDIQIVETTAIAPLNDHIGPIILFLILASMLLSMPVLISIHYCCFYNFQQQTPDLEGLANTHAGDYANHGTFIFDDMYDTLPKYAAIDVSELSFALRHTYPYIEPSQRNGQYVISHQRTPTGTTISIIGDTYTLSALKNTEWTSTPLPLPPPYERIAALQVD